MSARVDNNPLPLDSSIDNLAPYFRAAVELAIESCNAIGLDAQVHETYRSAELQAIYYARGRTVKPPDRPVTNAMSIEYSWHHYGLAIDVVSRGERWTAADEWCAKVAAVFKLFGCRWGGEWKDPDPWHFQWGRCKPSPSDKAREILSSQGNHDEGLRAVWKAVNAELPHTPGAIAYGAHANVSPEFKRAVIDVSNELGIPKPDYLMAAMAFETGYTFDPAKQSGASSARGLIQFMPDTAKGLNTTIEALAAMTQVEQMKYVKKHFERYADKLNTLDDVYMGIFRPTAVGKPQDHVLHDKQTDAKGYNANSGLDFNGDGKITKGEAALKVRAALFRGLQDAA